MMPVEIGPDNSQLLVDLRTIGKTGLRGLGLLVPLGWINIKPGRQLHTFVVQREPYIDRGATVAAALFVEPE